jgi:L-arabinonolactonase
MEIRAIVDCKTSLGEGPLWDVRDQKMHWIDSLGMKVFRANADGSDVEMWDVPQKIGSMALRETGGAILSLQDGVYAFDFGTGRSRLMLSMETDKPDNRLNDGKVDRQGRFIFGSMDTRETDKSGVLYRLESDLSLYELEGGIIVSNGPCWSPDNRTFYFADSWSMEISAFDKGQRETGVPDGATVDAEGYVWSAAIFSGELRRYDPDGKLERAISLPVRNVTSVNFGGPDLDILYFTSVGQIHLPGLPNDGPSGGSLFAIHGLGIKGLPEPRFAG